MRCYPDMSTAEELAEEAVISEPVSVSEFPVSRENTGNFCRLSPVIAMATLPFANKFKAFSPNSLRIGTGNFAD